MNHQMQLPLVEVTNGVLTTTTTAIAIGTENQHKNVLELLRKYLADFEEFGRVAFETRPFITYGGMQDKEVAILTEEQATLLITYMRNTAIVRAFKVRLVKEFWQMKRGEPSATSNPTSPTGPVPLIPVDIEANVQALGRLHQCMLANGLSPAAAIALHSAAQNNLMLAAGVPMVTGQVSGQIAGPAILGCVEVAKRGGVTIPNNLAGSFGKFVKSALGRAATTVERVVEGEFREVNGYLESDFPAIIDLAHAFMAARQ